MVSDDLPYERYLREVEDRFAHLEQLMGSPDDVESTDKFQELSKEYSRLKPLVELWSEYQQTRQDLEESRKIAEESEGEMAELAEAEIEELKDRLQTLQDDIRDELIPDDPDSDRNVVMEIRAGAGGEEASLFAADLFRMYRRYADEQGWKTEVVDERMADQGGYKEIVALMKGRLDD